MLDKKRFVKLLFVFYLSFYGYSNWTRISDYFTGTEKNTAEQIVLDAKYVPNANLEGISSRLEELNVVLKTLELEEITVEEDLDLGNNLF